MPPVDLDDNYTVLYEDEASTVDIYYLETSMLDEECGSIGSTSITSKKMLDYIVYGHSTKHNNANEFVVLVHGAGSRNNSGSNESLTHENGPYFSESTVFHNNTQAIPVLESHLGNEGAIESVHLQTNLIHSCITLESQNQIHTQNTNYDNEQETYLTESTGFNQQQTSSAEEVNGNDKLFATFEGTSTTTEVHPIHNSYSDSVGLENMRMENHLLCLKENTFPIHNCSKARQLSRSDEIREQS